MVSKEEFKYHAIEIDKLWRKSPRVLLKYLLFIAPDNEKVRLKEDIEFILGRIL